MIIAIILIFALCCALLINMAHRLDTLTARIELTDAALAELRPQLLQEKRWSEALNSILNYSEKVAMGGNENDE